ncbi:MAG: GntR family transcriptional regulator [Kiritimatiellae bacterium]|nr:GntR family transcriptional regulator [Kiritimatiellia bacterium]
MNGAASVVARRTSASVLDATTVLSKTDQVQSAITQAIRQQQIRPGKRVPSEAQLMTSLSVSRVTVRRAISNLVREGVLESRPGFGHVVRSAQGQLTIGILFGHTFLDVQAVPFHRLLLDSLQNHLNELNARFQLYVTRLAGMEHEHGRERFLTDVRKGRLHAVLTLAWPCPPDSDPRAVAMDAEMLELMRSRKVPYAAITEEDLPGAVGINAYRVGYLGATHFLDQNVRRIGLMVSREPGRFHLRVAEGYRAALSEHGMTDGAVPLCYADESSEAAGYTAFKRWWHASGQPDAIVIPDDFMCKGAMSAAIEMGVRIPARLQIAALTVKHSALFLPAPFVAIELDPVELASRLTKQLQSMIESPALMPDRWELEPKIARENTQ